MTSKSSFFDLCKENFIRHIWTFAVIVIILFFIFPINSLLSADTYLGTVENLTSAELANAKRYLYNDFVSLHSGGGMIFILAVFAVLTAFSGFSYLHDQKKTDFYHSLPVSRDRLYWSNIINSAVIVAVPYFIMAMLSALIISTKTGYSGCLGLAALHAVMNTGFYLLLYIFAVLSIMLTGNMIVGLFGTCIFYFWGPYIVTLFEAIMDQYFQTYYSIYERTTKLTQISSPFTWAFIDGDISTELRSAAACILSIVLAFAVLRIYKLRRSEAASGAMAFKAIKAPIKFIIVIPAALGFMEIFSNIMNNSDAWSVFAVVCGAVIVHSIIEIIYNLDFKKLFTHSLHMLGCLAVSLAVFAFFRFDIPGYDSYIPKQADIASGGVFSQGMEDCYGSENTVKLNDSSNIHYLSYDYLTEKDVVDRMYISGDQIENIIKLAEQGIASLDKENTAYTDSYNNKIWSVLIGWHLNNGKTVYREYPALDLSTARAELDSIHDSADFKNGVYPTITMTDAEVNDLAGVNYQDALGFHHVDFNGSEGEELKEKIKKLHSVYIKELIALKADTRRTESPVTTLQFKSSYFQDVSDTLREENDYGYGELNYIGHYPVYPSFTETLSLLKEYGVDLNEGLNADDISTIILHDFRGYDYYSDSDGSISSDRKADLMVTDKAQIQEILDAAEYSLNCGNNYEAMYYGLDTTAYLNRNFVYSTDSSIQSVPGGGYIAIDTFTEETDSYPVYATINKTTSAPVHATVYDTDNETGSDTYIMLESTGADDAIEDTSIVESTVYFNEANSTSDGSDKNAFAAAADSESEADVNAPEAQTESAEDTADYDVINMLSSDLSYGTDRTSRLTFRWPAQKIPQFVKDYFEISDEEITAAINTTP